ncbi:hypothetical protein M5K25_021972 [Dendrobium thyrsiflorum]|uniref:Uncharacterized protein n=1 Tax=Dendrobium thyrsiflorum TaxID=117978 RepID=A0ABD0UAX3_DENTH
MSMSDSDSSSGSGDYKNFRQATRDRLLHEMLRSTRAKDSKTRWKKLKFSDGHGKAEKGHTEIPFHQDSQPDTCLLADNYLAWKLAITKVLIMDKLTLKIISCSCKMANITEEGISLVEDIYKRRQPMPSMDAIYFIQPTKEK